jgi:uncharacterized protein (TIGR03084 family)
MSHGWRMTAPMDVTTALADQVAELAEILAPLGEEDWARPSPCEGWSVSDVVLHLAQTNALTTASAEARFTNVLMDLAGDGPSAGNVDDGAGRLVERERGEPGGVVRDRWQTSADAMQQALAACDPHARLPWVSGDVSARTLTTTRLAETWIHAGDVATGLGVTLPATDRLWHIARLAWRTLPYAFARAGRELGGPVRFDLTLPSGERAVFDPEPRKDRSADAPTVIRGSAEELCQVAARRRDPADTALVGEGPDAAAVLDLVRTYA